MEIDEETWATGGIEKSGKVAFRIDDAKIETRKTKKGEKFAICSIETTILGRPGETNLPESKVWDDFSLNPRYIYRFKNLAVGLGIKPSGKVKIPEVVKALNGRQGFGTIVHEEFTHQGEKRKKAKYGNKFAQSYNDLD